MGVPKFFRYISERYPCLSQLISDCDVPEFDNLYLDMNGIIHNCSHPNDFDPHFRITEEKIFKDIMYYIESLFRIIRPKKLFFMAVDGVAPRAKMNQQRGRRFRSAKDAEDREKEVVRKGITLPDAQKFDSNCITPGTSFMARLHTQLKYFVVSKISTDKSWQNIKVILSGHECPGEGEHKIMDYIRYLRSETDYDPNTRHCLYGLDADLIMLGLCTHEPHFSLLREEVKFGSRKQSKKLLSPDEIKFYLLHLSLLREYLEMEFDTLKHVLTFDFNIENIIDDWVLMGFLVGNDFIPHLPGLHISSGALPVLYKAYIEVLPSLDGYLNESGTLNLARFETYMRKLASFDIKQFREKYDDLKYFKHKIGKNSAINDLCENDVEFAPRPLKPFFSTNEVEEFEEEELEPTNDEQVQAVRDMMDLEEDEGSDYYDEDDKEKDRQAFFQEFFLHKQNYYQGKLEFGKITQEILHGQAEGYIKALQWNLNYYYNGICSWSWYYPHHYAPYISDIQNFKDIKLDFELGEPFLPFEQLLAVLPSLSKSLLPEPFQELMTDKSSPIFNYYPCEFETDLNGKKNDWEAVVLIPFIDEKKLLKAMESCYHRLTDEEKQRNKHGPMNVYTYTEKCLGRYEAPCYFNAINNFALETPMYREDIIVPREKLRKGLLDGVLLDVYFPGFPTFKHLKYTSKLNHQGVRVFQSSSQGLNMIVTIVKNEEEYNFDELVQNLMNKPVYSSWPYLTEGKVVSINDGKKKCILEGKMMKTIVLTEDQIKSFEQEVNTTKQDLLKYKGICVGETEVMLEIRTQEGIKYVFGSNGKIDLEKKWSNKLHSFPLQSIVRNLDMKEKDLSNITIDNIFPVGSNCFLLTKYYGCLGIVNDKSDNEHVKVKVTVLPEPNELDIIPGQTRIHYYNNTEAAHRSLIPNHLLARITGTILVLDTDDILQADKCIKVNIGLNLKFSRRNQLLPGYTKRNENNQWFYSNKTITLIREYADSFPEVIRYLAENSDKDLIFKKDLFPLPGQSHMLSVITNWLDSKSELKAERKSCDADLLEIDEIADVENKIEIFMKNNNRGKHINLKSKPFHLYVPSSQIEKQPPDAAEFQLLDRVVNVRDNFVVPLGYRGTVIGIEKNEKSLTEYDILFDQPFSLALQYHTKKKRVYKLPENCLLNISYQKRKQMREKRRIIPSQIKSYISTPSSTGMMNKSLPPAGKIISLMAQPVEMPPVIRPRPVVFSESTSSPDPCVRAALTKVSSVKSHVQNAQNQSPTVVPRSDTEANNFKITIAQGKPRVVYKSKDNPAPAAVPVSSKNEKESSKKIVGVHEELTETTKALKKLLRISDDKNKVESAISKKNERKEDESNETKPPKNENKAYVIELQELFQKAGKGIPKYDYKHSEGNFRANLHLPGLDIGITGDPAPTKQMAGERAAFVVLQFLNLVRNFGDKVMPVTSNENTMLEINLHFLRLQQQLQDVQRQYQQPQDPSYRTLQQRQQQQQQQYNIMQLQPDASLQQSVRIQQQPKLQMIMGTSQQQSSHMPASLPRPQTFMHQPSPHQIASYPPQSPAVTQQRQVTMAANYVYQPNVPAKYQLPSQQLYYQNVQNIFYNQSVRNGFQPTVSVPTPPPWFPPVMPAQQSAVVNMTSSMPPRYYAEQITQIVPQPLEKPVVQSVNYFAVSSQENAAYVPTTNAVTDILNEVPKANVEPITPRSVQIDSTACSGRASKTPRRNRLAANFATKAAT